MDFDFSHDVLEFAEEVERFLNEYEDVSVFDPSRENMAQLCDTPARRDLMKKLGERGWLGITWPNEWGGQNGEGVFEYVLNEALAGRGGPQTGKGVGIVGKTILAVGSDRMKQEFLPKILNNELEFAVAYSEPDAGSDAASMKLRATRDGEGWRLNGQKVWCTSAHFADWCWIGARTSTESKHHGITLFLVPMDHPGITVNPIWTIGGNPLGAERTNEVFFDDVFVHDDYVVGDLNRGFQYISMALDLERFSLFTYSPIKQRLDLLTEHVRAATVDDHPLKDDHVVRRRIAQLHTEAEVARVLGLRVVAASVKAEATGAPPPSTEAAEYKLYATQFSQRLADAAMDIASPAAQLRAETADAPMAGRPESAFRLTVLETIGGGGSEIQKNIIARRRLGLPKNF